jgi:hypothetical protein
MQCLETVFDSRTFHCHNQYKKEIYINWTCPIHNNDSGEYYPLMASVLEDTYNEKQVTKKSICELKNNLPGEVAANILEG